MPSPYARFTLALLLVAALISGEDPSIETYRSEGSGESLFLTLDASHAVAQDESGEYRWAMRVVAGKDGVLTQYLWGVPGLSYMKREKDALRVSLANGTTTRFVRIATPPPATGWQPYRLPATTADDPARTARAEELHRQASELQRLNEAYNAKVMAPGFSGNHADLPEAKAVQLQLTEIRRWLRETLQKEGWIAVASGPHVAADLAALTPGLWDFRLMNTIRAGVQAELVKGRFPEGEAVAIIDACAQILGDPLPYGSQSQIRPQQTPASMEMIVPVPVDLAAVDKARQRAGLPPLAQAAKGRIVRIAVDGRQVDGERPSEVPVPAGLGLDPTAMMQAASDPRTALQNLAKKDPAFAAAYAEAEKGRIDALSAWIRDSSLADRAVFGIAIQSLPKQGKPADLAQAYFAQRHLYLAFLAGAPATKLEEAPRISVSRDLAIALVGRVAAPSAAELEQAGDLAAALETGLQRRDLLANPSVAHPMADALACIYYRQGRLADAAATWKKAIGWAGKTVPESYRRRLQAAESGGKANALPR